MTADNVKPADAGAEGMKVPERRIASGEQAVHFGQEKKENVERRISPDDKIVSEELRREIDLMAGNQSLAKDINKEVKIVEFLGEKEKIEHLLKIARTKGLVYAISVARKMNEPYLLDVFHDTLAREGFYKKIGKPSDDDDDDDNKV